MDAVHKCRVVPHFRRQWREQMPDPLLLRHIHVEVAYHHQTAKRANIFLFTRKLA
jgi:hypothetical protein